MIFPRIANDGDEVPESILVTYDKTSGWVRPCGEVVPPDLVTLGHIGASPGARSYIVNRSVPARDRPRLWSRHNGDTETIIDGFMLEHEAKERPYCDSAYVEYTEYSKGLVVTIESGAGWDLHAYLATSDVLGITFEMHAAAITPEWAFRHWREYWGGHEAGLCIASANQLVGKIWRVK